jgi:RNA polymerase sigma-70 factor (ECF subfamily)
VEAVVREYRARLVRRCRRTLRDGDAAEDVVQQVFLRLWRLGHTFWEAKSRLAWLYRVADRCCYDRLAERRRWPESSPLEPEQLTLDGRRALEDGEALLRFLERFAEPVRSLIVLHHLHGLTQDEVAVATGWSRQTVCKKLSRARARAARWRETGAL